MRDRSQDPHEDEASTAVDRLLRALADQEQEDGLPAPGDPQLRAYREGRLSPKETRELEALLARSAAGRRRLLELAGVDRSLPLRRVRKAVLGHATRSARPRQIRRWVSAAAVAASLVLALLFLFPRQRPLPAGLAYDVTAQGLAEVRSSDAVGGAAGSAVRAYPATTVHILVRPRGDSPAGISFALFRREGGVLQRVRQPDEVRLVSERGTAAFAGAAAAVLATGTPGVYPLYVVASSQDKLPALVTIEPGQDPTAALRASGRLVYPVTVTLLRDEPPAKDGAR